MRTGETCGSAEGHGGKIRRAGDADLLIGLRHSALRSGDVRAPLQKFRRESNRNAGRLVVERRGYEAEVRRRLSDENRNGVFELRSLYGDIRILNASRIKLRLRLRNIGLRGYAPLEAIERELQVVGIGFYSIVEKLLLSVGAAQFEIIQSKFRLKAELCGLIIGIAGLRFFPRGSDATPYAAPKVQFVGKVKGQHEIASAGLLYLGRKALGKV